MSISEFSEVLGKQKQVLNIIVPVIAALAVTYLIIVGGYLAVQKVRKKMEDETDKKHALIVVSLMSTLLLAVAAAIVISVVQGVDRVIRGFRVSVSGWAESVGTNFFYSQLLALDSQYTVLFWSSVALAAVLIAACFFLTWRAKRTYVDLRETKPVIHSAKGLIAVTSSIIPEYNEENEDGEADMVQDDN